MKRKGFSLIELVIVLVLIGFSIALVTPSLSQFARRVELKTAAQKISGILRYFRSESIQKGKTHQVLFDPYRREVRVRALEGEKKEEGEMEGNDSKGKEKLYSLPAGIHMEEFNIVSSEFPSDLPAIEFYPNGGSNGGSLILNTQDQKGYRIKVHFITGMVEVEGV
jgi:general secretion pathway protein H